MRFSIFRSSFPITGDEPNWPSDPSEDLLTFTPEQVLAGVSFHLMDEKLASKIDRGSSLEFLERLKQNLIEPFISRTQWCGMSNSSRVDWLLKRGRIVAQIGPSGTAILKAAQVWTPDLPHVKKILAGETKCQSDMFS